MIGMSRVFLRNELLRQLYYRFGEEILNCKECVTQRDFLARGLIQSLGFHIVSGLALLFFSAIGKSNNVAFVRSPY